MAQANWERWEARVASLIEGRRTPGSGNGSRKGDVSGPFFLAECKETSVGELQLTLTWFSKLWEESRRARRIPLFAGENASKQERFFVPLSFVPETILVLENQFPKVIDLSQCRSYGLKPTDSYGQVYRFGNREWVLLTTFQIETWQNALKEEHSG